MPSLLDDLGTTLGDAILIFVMGVYWLTSHERATGFIMQLSPPRYRATVGQAVDEIESTLGGYVRGVTLISVIVGLLNFSAMQLLGVPNAITLAFISAITTTIPMIGGLIGVVLALLLTLVIAPEYVIVVIVIAFVIQQIEAYILGPRIMSNSVGLDPLLVIVYTAIGFVMFGVVGALIAVPIMGAIHILVTHFVIKPYQDSIRQFQMEQGVPILTVDTAIGGRVPYPEKQPESK
jgi:predicted PurR-regulated permease PerM